MGYFRSDEQITTAFKLKFSIHHTGDANNYWFNELFSAGLPTYLDSVWSDLDPVSDFYAYNDGNATLDAAIVQKRTWTGATWTTDTTGCTGAIDVEKLEFPLTALTGCNNQSHIALATPQSSIDPPNVTPSMRMRDFINFADFGSDFTPRAYWDNGAGTGKGLEITTLAATNGWIFDSFSGVMLFGSTTGGTYTPQGTLPVWIVVYRYIGTKGAAKSTEAVTKTVNQTTHGLSICEPVYFNGTSWVTAQANTDATTADGVVFSVEDANNFTIIQKGWMTATTGEWDAVTGDVGGLTPGQNYVLSQSASGMLTSTHPAGGIIQFVLKAISTTEALIYVGEPYDASIYDLSEAVSELVSEATEFSEGISEAKSIGFRVESEAEVAGSFAIVADSVADRAESLARVANTPKTFIQATVPVAGMVDGDRWRNTTDDIWVTYNGTEWLSDEKLNFTFTTDGNVDGTYVTVNGTTGSDAGHPILRNAKVLYIAARASSGEATKSFELRRNGTSTSLFGFSLSSLEYRNSSVDIDLSTGDNLQCFCLSTGTAVSKPVIDVTICWRY